MGGPGPLGERADPFTGTAPDDPDLARDLTAAAARNPRSTLVRHRQSYLKSPAKKCQWPGVCGGDTSPPDGTCETQNVKSGSEKGTVAGHVGDITSGAAETPL